MSWKNVKSLLIILLVIVNTLLAVVAINYYKDSRFTDSDTALAASEILAKSNITVSSDLLAVKNDSAETLSCAFNRENYLAFVCSLLFGKEADGVYMLPSGIKADTIDGETALLGYDLSIDYTNAALAGEINTALENAKEIPHEDSKTARKALEKQIAMVEDSLKNAKCTAFGDYIFITVCQIENGLSLYDMNCVFGLKGDKIVYALGKHFFGVPTEKENAQLLDRVNIMFSEKTRGEVGTVNDISLCYTLYEDTHSDRMLFVPAYMISYDDGRVTAINAISKEKY